MNTDHTRIDYAKAQDAIKLIDQAESMLQINAGLDVLAAATGLSHYLALDMLGIQPQICNALHNLANIDVEAVVQNDLVSRLLVRLIPIAMNHEVGLGIDALRFGVAVSAPLGNSTCLLFMGRSDAPLEEDSIADRLGIASVCVTHLLGSMVRMRRESCPLSVRELQCLCLAANGLSSKETARRLGISHRTVEDHLTSCRCRLNASATLPAVIHALRKGWFSLDDIEAANLLSISPRSEAGRG